MIETPCCWCWGDCWEERRGEGWRGCFDGATVRGSPGGEREEKINIIFLSLSLSR